MDRLIKQFPDTKLSCKTPTLSVNSVLVRNSERQGTDYNMKCAVKGLRCFKQEEPVVAF